MRPLTRAALALALLLAGCRDEDPIAAVIHSVAEAAEDREAEAVVEHLAAGYAGANGGRAEVKLALQRYFFAYRVIDVAIHELETQHGRSEGSATFRVAFTGVPKEIGGMDQFLPRADSYRFHVALVNEAGAWRISSADWQRVESAP